MILTSKSHLLSFFFFAVSQSELDTDAGLMFICFGCFKAFSYFSPGDFKKEKLTVPDSQ